MEVPAWWCLDPDDSGLNVGNAILSNLIYGNAALGIDLGGDGVTPNHVGGLITGPNGFQNYPVLSSATSTATQTTINGSLNGAANTTYTIQFFSNTTADPSGFGQGQTYLGSTSVTTDSTGNVTFSATLNVQLAAGQSVERDGDGPERQYVRVRAGYHQHRSGRATRGAGPPGRARRTSTRPWNRSYSGSSTGWPRAAGASLDKGPVQAGRLSSGATRSFSRMCYMPARLETSRGTNRSLFRRTYLSSSARSRGVHDHAISTWEVPNDPPSVTDFVAASSWRLPVKARCWPRAGRATRVVPSTRP